MTPTPVTAAGPAAGAGTNGGFPARGFAFLPESKPRPGTGICTAAAAACMPLANSATARCPMVSGVSVCHGPFDLYRSLSLSTTQCVTILAFAVSLYSVLQFSASSLLLLGYVAYKLTREATEPAFIVEGEPVYTYLYHLGAILRGEFELVRGTEPKD